MASNESQPPTIASGRRQARGAAEDNPADGEAAPAPAEPPKKRKRLTLMESLILHGRPTSDVRGRPRKSNAPGTVLAVPPSQKPRAFLVPSIETDEGNANTSTNNDDTGHNSDESLFVRNASPTPTQRVRARTPRENTPPGFQPDRELASKDTAFHQLYFPGQLNLQFKAEVHKWNEKPRHSDRTVFVLNHLVDGDVVDQHVYMSLNDANADVLEVMAKSHPEVFALSREADSTESAGTPANQTGQAQDEVEIKIEEPESAQAILKWLEPNNGQNVSSGLAARKARASQSDADPEAKYLYWGQWKFVSHCLKMEARMRDGSQVKVFVSLKNLRTAREA